ncbi:Regulatory associated protein of TOR [Parasponia andersonii]|uniref:Regulatory associated protein of TOR n=1 Tax=Parasponia andersonii TaxID=3476 RepID=A0A2P5ATU6_PARAD|nr:Regulatory associated protein of TOR [Parasponia andersonii]
MKCRSVACIWPDTVPSHRVTATAVLNHPPTLYTGGSDGSIIWWNLSSSNDSNSEFKPTAMLCGHAATIAGLDICNPVVVSGNGEKYSSNNLIGNSSCDTYSGALISVCSDGVLCVWSRSGGHCRQRRKLPPWVGSPFTVRTLESKPRYVCIACCFADTVHLSDHHSVDSMGLSDVSADSESQNKKGPKCSVVIVDTYTLTIVQTVFHGNLSIGSLKSMAVVSSTKEEGKHSVVLSDSFGRLQLLSITKDFKEEKEHENALPKCSSQLEIAVQAEGISVGGHVMSITIFRNIIAFVLRSQCIFKLLDSGTTIGEISFVDNFVREEGDSTQLHVVGCMFLKREDASNMLNTEEPYEIREEHFAVWDDKGRSIVYLITYSKDIFTCKPLYEIPITSCSHDPRLSTFFIQLNHYILRIESVCINAEEPLHWQPFVTIYSPSQKHNENGDLSFSFRMHGPGSSFVDWKRCSNSIRETEDSAGIKTELSSRQCVVPSTKSTDTKDTEKGNHGVVSKQQVSSSMVIAETSFAPYAIVYGFISGKIEVLRFDLLEGLDFYEGSPHHGVNSHTSRQHFLGHTGAVLCLASHRMVGNAKRSSFNKILVSGSRDCTVRIWNLDTGNIISVMHHHVAPVHQIILPPFCTEHPWSDCFLSIGEDLCVTLSSFETLRVERMFPGHPNYPAKVVWDGARGYIACLCPNNSGTSDTNDILYIWDVKTGARERVIRGTASHSMFEYFCKGISMNSVSGTILNENTSVSSLLLPIIEDGSSSKSHLNKLETLVTLPNSIVKPNTLEANVGKGCFGKSTASVNCSCPFPGIATLSFNLASLMFNYQKHESVENCNNMPKNNKVREQVAESSSPHHTSSKHGSDADSTSNDATNELDWTRSLEECLVRFSLSFLHLWDVDPGLDCLLLTYMKLERPKNFIVASGLQGDRGSLTLAFPDLSASLELWRSSSEFCAMRSLTMVSLAQRMISLSHSSSSASSALAAFYTRNFADKFQDIKPPLLQLLVSFWQDESEHIRMAARTLFHCAASRAIPLPLCGQKATNHAKTNYLTGPRENGNSNVQVEETSATTLYAEQQMDTRGICEVEQSNILAWLESFEMQDWISCVGGTSQDAMTSHIIVAAALAIWYPSLVKPCLAMLVVHPLMKLVMAMNDKYSCTAAELLAEGMESTWKPCIGPEIPQLIGDIFFQIECVSGPSANLAQQKSGVPNAIRETLVGVLLPSLAMADVTAYLGVIESQIWSTASDSPVHLVSLMTLIRVVRSSPKSLAQFLDKVVNFILQTMDPSNSVMRKTCFQSSMKALKEVVHAFPMVAINGTWTRLAVGDVIGEIKSASIRVYDLQSVMKIKVLDASGPPGLPTLLAAASETVVANAISVLSFSPDGEGLVAFSEHGLMIRWWSLGSVWWEKLSRNLVPVQCTKLIFVPPWEGFSPNSSRSSIMASIMGHNRQVDFQENPKVSNHPDNLKLLIHNVDLSYRLEWFGERKVLLSRHGHELGTFQL